MTVVFPESTRKDSAPAPPYTGTRSRRAMDFQPVLSASIALLGGRGGGRCQRVLFSRRRERWWPAAKLKRDKAVLALAALSLLAGLLCFDAMGMMAPVGVKKLKLGRKVAAGGPNGRGGDGDSRRGRGIHWASSARKKDRKLENVAESWCYDGNMLDNGGFDKGRAEWSHHGTAAFSTEWTDVEGTTTRVAVIQDRGDVYHGIKQDIGHAIPCMTGSDFFLHITARVKMYNKETGEGVNSCMNGEALVANEWNKNHCPFVRFHGWKNNDTGTFSSFDSYDTLHAWDGDAWNTIDFITDVIPALQGDDLTKLVFSVRGGPADAVVLVDDIVVRRMEPEDIPVNSPIYDPDSHHDCETNMIKNGGAEYQSPLEWDVHRFWKSERGATIDNLDLGNHEHAFLLTNRVEWRQGIGQDIDPYFCLKEPNLYVQFSFDVKVYHEWSGTAFTGPKTSCAPHFPNWKNCPQLNVWYADPGVSWDVSRYKDDEMIFNWDPYGWNKFDIIVAVNPGVTYKPWKFTRIATEGGTPRGAILIDNMVMKKIPYEKIPAGKAIYDWSGKTKTTPIMECHSIGDPHLMTFSGNMYDNHTEGWQPLYIHHDLRVEALQKGAGLREDVSFGFNAEVKITYKGVEYYFADKVPLPSTDQYYSHHDGGLQERFVFGEGTPDAKVYVQSMDTYKAAHVGKLGNVWYNVYIYTKDVFGAGLCCDIDQPPAESEEIQFPDFAPSRAEAEEVCEELEDKPNLYQNCIFDFRAVSAATNDTEAARELVVETVVAQTSEATSIVQQETQSESYAELTGGGNMYEDAANAGAQGDPTIVGVKNQAFKFDGRSDAWYANLASESVQWNMKFHEFEGCAAEADMFVTGVTVGLRERHRIAHSVVIRVRDENSFFPGCDFDDDEEEENDACLGAGSLEIVLDGETITKPGDYFARASTPSSSAIRVVAYNTYAACSRKWYDYDGPPQQGSEGGSVESDSRTLSHSKLPLDFLADSLGTAIRPNVCADWMHERTTNDDLFRQAGSWTTVHVETPLVSFHIEYRQNARTRGDPTTCFSHSIDAWMAEISPKLRSEEWRGILGETRYKESTESDREVILMGKDDEDYEVSGPYGTNFGALGASHWFWPLRGGLRGFI
uniref:VWFD domain-containing protein n=1 Tax=Odontella aurita TaxID=265563 RepID=A0A7S4JTY2_9STRA|mmetsp:Transcript_53471/g.159989  ORF Transcript_53471/g.159989 Transcript_53471/m.159989 type:complete len:1125 (+) Transcript_53471:130-3504(+)